MPKPRKAPAKKAKKLTPSSSPQNPGDRGPSLIFIPTRQSGVTVTEDTALTLGAVFACVRVISEDIAGLPWRVFEQRIPGPGSDERPDDPADWLLHTQANPETPAFQFRETMLAWALTWGNGYAEIERDLAGRPMWLWQLSPDRVTPKRKNGRLIYVVKNPVGPDTELEAEDMYHLRGLGFDGLQGYSVIRLAARSIGAGIALEEAAASFWGNDATPGGVLKHPRRLTDKARENLFKSWGGRHQGPSRRRTLAILEEGLEWEQTGLPPEDTQMIEARQFTPADICRWFRVSPPKIADLLRATFSNIEELAIWHVTDTLRPWVGRLECEANIKLFGRNNRGKRFSKINMNALLRGQTAARSAFYVAMLDRAVFSVNDVLSKEDMNPIGPDGDKRFIPLNMQLLENAGELPGATTPAPGQAAPMVDDKDDALLDVPDLRQSGNYDCGACCVHSVAEFFGVGGGRTEQDYITELGTTQTDGTEPDAMIDWFNDQGLLTTSGPGMTVDDLERFCEGGSPVIVPVQMYGTTPGYDAEEAQNQTGHYVIVIGVGLGQVFFQDPSAGRQMLPAADFEKIWHDIEADGVVDDHFGIAVFQSMPVETTPEVPANGMQTPQNGKPSAPNGQAMPQNGNMRAAVLPVLTEACARASRRAEHRRADAVKRLAGDALVSWEERFRQEQMDYLREVLKPGADLLAILLAKPTEADKWVASWPASGETAEAQANGFLDFCLGANNGHTA